MNKKFIKYVVVFLICVCVGLGFYAQSKITDGQALYVSPETIDEYQVQIDSEIKEIANLKTQIELEKQRLAQYTEEFKTEEKENVAMTEKLSNELYLYQIMTGMTEVHGPGVKITVDDGTRPLLEGENINNLIVHDIDILLIINELKQCKAEAIAVNGHRITPNTSITCSGYTVRMDGQVYARPFIITAIGDYKRMSNVLLAPEGYGTSLQNWGVQFYLEVSDDITVPAAESMKTQKYSKEAVKKESVKEE